MNTNKQKLFRFLLTLVGFVFVFQSCKPVRTVKSQRSSYKIAGDTDELGNSREDNKSLNRLRMKNRGEKAVVDKNGDVIRTEKRGDLYSDRASLTVRESGSAFRGQDSNVDKKGYKSKSFKTPEYLKGKDRYASQSFRERDQQARTSEKNFTHRLFKTDAARGTQKSAREAGKEYRNHNQFKVSDNRNASKAQDSAALATGVRNNAGYKKSPLTVDDVRKLVHPESVQ